jgi:hypothetical protein
VATLANQLDAAAMHLSDDPTPINAWVAEHTAGLIDKVGASHSKAAQAR